MSDEQPSTDLLKRWIELGLLMDWLSSQSNKEINSINQYVEEQAQELVENFRSISKEAKDQSSRVADIVETSTTVMIDDEAISLVEVVADLDKLMAHMIGDIVDISKSAMNMVFVMKQVVEDADKISANLGQIYQITKDTKYLSINALIEAARAGEAGKGFAVVANEVGELSKDTEELANSMGEMITLFTARLKEGFSLLEDIASKDLTEQLQNKENIDKTMVALVDQAVHQKEILQTTVQTSDNISNAVSKLIMAMQFQDYAKQRMQHVTGASETMQNELKQLLDESASDPSLDGISTELSEDAAMAMLDKFSLSKLKETFLKGLNEEEAEEDEGDDDIFFDSSSDESSSVDEDGDDIELF